MNSEFQHLCSGQGSQGVPQPASQWMACIVPSNEKQVQGAAVESWPTGAVTKLSGTPRYSSPRSNSLVSKQNGDPVQTQLKLKEHITDLCLFLCLFVQRGM